MLKIVLIGFAFISVSVLSEHLVSFSLFPHQHHFSGSYCLDTTHACCSMVDRFFHLTTERWPGLVLHSRIIFRNQNQETKPGNNQCHHLSNWTRYVTLDHAYCQFKHWFCDTPSLKIKTYHISYATCLLTRSELAASQRFTRNNVQACCTRRNHNNPPSHYLQLQVSVPLWEASPNYQKPQTRR